MNRLLLTVMFVLACAAGHAKEALPLAKIREVIETYAGKGNRRLPDAPPVQAAGV